MQDAVSEDGDLQGYLDSDMTYWTDPAGHAGIWDSGTTNWIPSLAACPHPAGVCPAAMVGRITGNLLALFGRGPAGRRQPSRANWRTIYK